MSYAIVKTKAVYVDKVATALNNRKRVINLQHAIDSALIDGTLGQCELPLEHTFTEGNYARTMFIKKGIVVVGKIHKHAHLNFITEGHVSVLTEGGLTEYKAPIMFVSVPGTKRAVFAHEDTKWTTVHPTDKTDLVEIENEVIAKSFEEYEALVLSGDIKQLK
jgi:quercetin dioxygenase-like cupin family protein